MKMKIVAFLAFLLNTFLFGSYYSFAKEALSRIDPIVFTFFVMTSLVPLALCLLVLSWHDISREIVKSGALLGSCLCLGLFMLSISLKYNTATSTAFFPAVNGFLAAICAWLFLRQPIAKTTWFAGVLSVGGALLLILNSSMGGARGALIAFIGGLFCTFYVFLADYEQRDKKAHWALLGVQLITMAVWANLIALLFGDWQMVHPSLPKDVWIVLYIALGTTCLPTVFTVLLQRYLAPLTVSFIYILEPVLGAIVAYFYLGEMLPLVGYIGGGLIVAGALFHTWGSAERPAGSALALHQRLSLSMRRFNQSPVAMLGYPLLWFCAGAFTLYKTGGLPPIAWLRLYQLMPALPAYMEQMHAGRSASVGVLILLVTQSFSLLVGWVALTGIALLLLSRARLLLRRSVVAAAQPAEVPVVVETPVWSVFTDQEVWDTRFLRQVGISATPTPPGRRWQDKPVVQRRRRARTARLAQAELVE
jgi:drug/metabolite transporter (DMT)-like permease